MIPKDLNNNFYWKYNYRDFYIKLNISDFKQKIKWNKAILESLLDSLQLLFY